MAKSAKSAQPKKAAEAETQAAVEVAVEDTKPAKARKTAAKSARKTAAKKASPRAKKTETKPEVSQPEAQPEVAAVPELVSATAAEEGAQDAKKAVATARARAPRAVGVAAFRDAAQDITKSKLTPRQLQALLSLSAKHFGVLDIRPGQVWQGNDTRRGVRIIQVLDVAQGRVKVRNTETEVVSEVAASSFNLGARGFSLIEG